MKIKYGILSIICGLALIACTKQSSVRYENEIRPLLVTCANQYCHGGGTVNFTDYDSTVESVNTGRVLGALKQEVGYKAMPSGNEIEGKWSAKDIEILENWIADGMPE